MKSLDQYIMPDARSSQQITGANSSAFEEQATARGVMKKNQSNSAIQQKFDKAELANASSNLEKGRVRDSDHALNLK